MLSIKLKIKSIFDVDYIKNKQQQYSYAFRKLWSNINKIKDNNYLNELKFKFDLTDIEVRSLISDVKTKFEQTTTEKKNKEIEILEIENKIKFLKSLKKSNKLTRKIFKSKNKLTELNKNLSNNIVFGGRKLLSEISYLSNDITNNEIVLKTKKEEYINNRLLFAYFLGEANQKGNRFFKFDFNNKKITYKPNRNAKINIEFYNYNSYKKELLLLQKMIDIKSIAVTIQLSTEFIILMFDNEKLNGFALDEIERRKEINKIKQEHSNKETIDKLIKETYSKYFKEQEQRKLNNKLNYRYLSIDTNPDYIGLAVLDKTNDEIGFKIVNTFNYDLTQNNKKLPRSYSLEDRTHFNNKRRHGITHIWKDIFEIFTYYNCGYLVLEDLNLKDKDLGNVVSNRKINNVWYRELSNQLIEKYCNKLGIIKIEVNPCYSSFIGNLTNNYVDPINAAIEIGRRGINKYIKNKFYPPLEIGTIMNAMSKLNSTMLNELRDVLLRIKDNENWQSIYKKIVKDKTGLRYRLTLDDVIRNNDIDFNVSNKLLHSNIEKYCFNSSKEGLSIRNEKQLIFHNYA
jgi:hypothetical protein